MARRSPSRNKRKDPKRVAAGRKAAITRRANAEKRSAAARKGWVTRRKRAEAPPRKKGKEKNREYLLTIERRAAKGKKKKKSPLPPKSRLPDLLTIFDRDASETAVVAFTIATLERSKGTRWQGRVIQHAYATGQLIVAAGPETNRAKGVSPR